MRFYALAERELKRTSTMPPTPPHLAVVRWHAVPVGAEDGQPLCPRSRHHNDVEDVTRDFESTPYLTRCPHCSGIVQSA